MVKTVLPRRDRPSEVRCAACERVEQPGVTMQFRVIDGIEMYLCVQPCRPFWPRDSR